MWFPGGQHRVSKVDTMWFLQDTTGFPHGCHVVSIWTPCVVEVTTLKPAQKQLCMKPTCFLVIIIIDQERRLASLLLLYAHQGFPFTPIQMCQLAYDMAEEEGNKGLSPVKKTAGRKWLKFTFKCKTELNQKQPEFVNFTCDFSQPCINKKVL